MIKNLKINNFIIVPSLNIDFSNGFSVVTGETGAGKSIVLGAIDLILGSPIKSGLHFDKSKKVYLEAVFDINEKNKKLLDLVKKYDLDTSESEIFFAKEITKTNKAKSFLNGRRVTNSIIKDFRPHLIDFHSQRDQQILLNSAYQKEALDLYGNLKNLKAKYEKVFNNIIELEQKLKKLQQKEKFNKEKVELFKFQMKEIKEAELTKDEDNELNNELSLLNNAEEILNNAYEFEQQIFESDDSVFNTINYYLGNFEKYSDSNQHILNLCEILQNVMTSLQESITEVHELTNQIDIDRKRQNIVTERLDEITRLKDKYQMNINDLIEHTKELKKEIDQYSSHKNKIKELQDELQIERKDLKDLGNELSVRRKKVAKDLAIEIEENLKELAMKDAAFNIQVSPLKKGKFLLNDEYYGIEGKDYIEFRFSANKGVQKSSLKKAASGGELSRILLGLKKVLSKNMNAKTIIFDEIDTGIGGETANKLGKFIAKIAESHQIICITHLAQIATYSKYHLLITKESNDKKTTIHLKKLNSKERVSEIARMISGSKNELSKEHAKQLLEKK